MLFGGFGVVTLFWDWFGLVFVRLLRWGTCVGVFISLLWVYSGTAVWLL